MPLIFLQVTTSYMIMSFHRLTVWNKNVKVPDLLITATQFLATVDLLFLKPLHPKQANSPSLTLKIASSKASSNNLFLAQYLD